MKGKKVQGNRGYVALFAVMITAFVGLAIIASLAGLAFNSNSASTTLLQSQQAKGLANACAELGLQKLIGSSSFTGTTTISLGAGSCTYTVAQVSSSLSTISAQGTVGAVTRKVKVSVTVANVMPVLQISSWQEVADF